MRRQSCSHTILMALILGTLTLVSQQSLATSDFNLESSRLGSVAHSVIHEGRVRVIITKVKAKLHLPKSYKPATLLKLDDDDNDYYDELTEFQVGYRRPELINQSAEVELSDEIKIRLLLARKRALDTYHANWS